jgi:hypothetical protein
MITSTAAGFSRAKSISMYRLVGEQGFRNRPGEIKAADNSFHDYTTKRDEGTFAETRRYGLESGTHRHYVNNVIGALRDLWHLTNLQASWILSVWFVGIMVGAYPIGARC